MHANPGQNLNEPERGEGQKDEEACILHTPLRHAVVVYRIHQLDSEARAVDFLAHPHLGFPCLRVVTAEKRNGPFRSECNVRHGPFDWQPVTLEAWMAVVRLEFYDGVLCERGEVNAKAPIEREGERELRSLPSIGEAYDSVDSRASICKRSGSGKKGDRLAIPSHGGLLLYGTRIRYADCQLGSLPGDPRRLEP